MASKDNITYQISAAEGKLARLFPDLEDGTSITVAVNRDNYSASAIARAVEDCNTHLLNLNITADGALPGGDKTGDVILELRVAMRFAMPVVRSLERYGYRVLSASSGGDVVDLTSQKPPEEVIDETLRERVNLLLRLID